MKMICERKKRGRGEREREGGRERKGGRKRGRGGQVNMIETDDKMNYFIIKNRFVKHFKQLLNHSSLAPANTQTR